MSIYTIFTGGTIGSRKDDTGVIKTANQPYRLLDKYRNQAHQYADEVEFVTDEPYRILSENLTAENILLLIDAVNRALAHHETEGIIITHGTDTLQYTAALLGYVFADVELSIVIVSSNYVLDDVRANGLIHFQCAVDFIRNAGGKGVFVSYCNTGEMCYIHRATRLQSPVLLSDYVSSVMDSWYGRFAEGRFEKNPHYYEAAEQTDNPVFQRFHIRLSDKSNAILRITPYVGMTYPTIREDVKAILHESYHSGTIRISRELEEFARQAKERKIPIFLTGLNHREAEYETVSSYRSYGIIPLPECAVTAQYCKLWLTVSNEKNIPEVMNKSIGGDFINPLQQEIR